MSKSLIKNTLREIRGSFGRFISITCIIALGVGFFAGLKTTREDMLNTANTYLSEHNFFDYRLMNSYGFDDDSVASAQNYKDVKSAEGVYSFDAIMESDGVQKVYKIMNIPETLNTPSLASGRLPQKDNECLADKRMMKDGALGKKFVISDTNKKDTSDKLKVKEFTVVGLVSSPLYLNTERGTTSLLNGTVSAFIYLPKSALDIEYYNELYLKLNTQEKIYSTEYKDYISSQKNNIEALSKQLGNERYDSIVTEARDKYDENYDEYEKNLKKYNDEKRDAEKNISDAEYELVNSENKLKKSKIEYENGLAEYNSGNEQLKSGKKQLDDGYNQVNSGIADSERALEQLNVQLAAFNSYPVLDEANAAAKAILTAKAEEAKSALKQLEQKKKELDKKSNELSEKEKLLAESKKKLENAKSELYNGENKLKNGRAELEEQKAEANKKFGEAKKKLDKAKDKLDKAKRDIDDIKKADCYTLDRQTNVGYVCFENDSGIVDGLAEVFPVFFFLVAALMCMTTMTRMVDEQRTDIGVLKALGYSKSVITAKYLSYSGLAAIIGCTVGFFGGSWVFPMAIWNSYSVLYGFAPLKITYNAVTAIGLMIVALICTTGTTAFSILGSLNENAAQIMRPKAPKSGKHAFFEKFGAFKRMTFLHKVSVRNLMRYKGRFIMMVLGVAGCTALLITGFGIKDSIQKICDYQYGEIMTHDYEITFSHALDNGKKTRFDNDIKNIGTALYLHNSTYDISTKKGTKTANVIAADDSNFSEYICLKDGSEKLDFPKKGYAVVTKKFAQNNGISVGSEISITDSDRKIAKVKVSALCDNYVYNYIYTSIDTLSDGFGYTPEVKSAYIRQEDNKDIDSHEISAKIMNMDNVQSVTDVSDLLARVSNMLKSIDYIVLLVTACAGALAFVVIYNLTNINITERIREIATIKVLGFYPNETASYVFGENFVLTAIGAFLGIFLGRALHAFVMSKINIEMVSFEVRVALISYILSIVLTFAFAVLVDFFMYFKLKKIDMAQSLKSIE